MREITLAQALALLAQRKQNPIGINQPAFAAPPQEGVAPTDVTGAYALRQAALDNAYRAQVAQASSGNSAAAGVAGAGLSAAAAIF